MRCVALVVLVVTLFLGWAAILTCSSCNECTSVLESASSGDTVLITADLYDVNVSTGLAGEVTCLYVHGYYDVTNPLIIDCNGHSIVLPDDEVNTIGIAVWDTNGLVIRNCRIVGGDIGIRFWVTLGDISVENVTIQNTKNSCIAYSCRPEGEYSVSNSLLSGCNIGIYVEDMGILGQGHISVFDTNILDTNAPFGSNWNFFVWDCGGHTFVSRVISAYGVYGDEGRPIITVHATRRPVELDGSVDTNYTILDALYLDTALGYDINVRNVTVQKVLEASISSNGGNLFFENVRIDGNNPYPPQGLILFKEGAVGSITLKDVVTERLRYTGASTEIVADLTNKGVKACIIEQYAAWPQDVNLVCQGTAGYLCMDQNSRINIVCDPSRILSCADCNVSAGTELCTNGIDDDGDGLVDCDDPDCASDPACVAASINTTTVYARLEEGAQMNVPVQYDTGVSSRVNVTPYNVDWNNSLTLSLAKFPPFCWHGWEIDSFKGWSVQASGDTYLSTGTSITLTTSTPEIYAVYSTTGGCEEPPPDSDGNYVADFILVRVVRQGAGTPVPDATVTISVEGYLASKSALTDVNGETLFKVGCFDSNLLLTVTKDGYETYQETIPVLLPCDTTSQIFEVTVNLVPTASEDCSDGIDNDGDGFIDCDDLDCDAYCPVADTNYVITGVEATNLDMPESFVVEHGTKFYVGDTYLFNVNVVNLGTGSGPSTLKLFVNGQLIDSAIVDIAPGDWQIVHVLWTPTTPGTTLTFSVDANWVSYDVSALSASERRGMIITGSVPVGALLFTSIISVALILLILRELQ